MPSRCKTSQFGACRHHIAKVSAPAGRARGHHYDDRMTAISREDVAHLANLARIDLNADELDRFALELPAILDSVATVSAVATDDVPAMSHPLPVSNVFRADEIRPSLAPEDALAGAPEVEQQRFLVPRILGEEA